MVLAAKRKVSFGKFYNKAVKRNSARKREDTFYVFSSNLLFVPPLGSNGMNWRSPQMKTLNPIHSSFPTFQNCCRSHRKCYRTRINSRLFSHSFLLINGYFSCHIKTNSVPLAWPYWMLVEHRFSNVNVTKKQQSLLKQSGMNRITKRHRCTTQPSHRARPFLPFFGNLIEDLFSECILYFFNIF